MITVWYKILFTLCLLYNKMTRLKALAETLKKYTNVVDGNILHNTSVIDIIIYYEYLLETNKAEIKYNHLKQLKNDKLTKKL